MTKWICLKDANRSQQNQYKRTTNMHTECVKRCLIFFFFFCCYLQRPNIFDMTNFCGSLTKVHQCQGLVKPNTVLKAMHFKYFTLQYTEQRCPVLTKWPKDNQPCESWLIVFSDRKICNSHLFLTFRFFRLLNEKLNLFYVDKRI